MQLRTTEHDVYLRIDKGEPLFGTIRAACERLGIRGGHFQGIGACSEAVVSTWLPEKAAFTDHELHGTIEMVSLMGNVSTDADGGPYLHAHACFSYLDDAGRPAVLAGHASEAVIGYTGEVVITPADAPIGRVFDERAGIDVWNLEG